MSVLIELTQLLSGVIPCETGVFSDAAPDKYLVVTPLSDTFTGFADDRAEHELCEARLSVFDKGNYTQTKNTIIRLLLASGFYITGRRYMGFEPDTGYHHYAIDCGKCMDASIYYGLEED